MRILTLRYINGEFVVTAPNLEAVSFKSKRAAKLWCTSHYHGLSIMEVGPGCSKWAA